MFLLIDLEHAACSVDERVRIVLMHDVEELSHSLIFIAETKLIKLYD